MFAGFVGLTASCGSSSPLRKFLPVWPASWLAHAAYGVGPETVTGPRTAADALAAAAIERPAASEIADARCLIRSLLAKFRPVSRA